MRKEDERMDTWREGGMDQQTYGWIRLGPEKCKVKKLFAFFIILNVKFVHLFHPSSS